MKNATIGPQAEIEPRDSGAAFQPTELQSRECFTLLFTSFHTSICASGALCENCLMRLGTALLSCNRRKLSLGNRWFAALVYGVVFSPKN